MSPGVAGATQTGPVGGVTQATVHTLAREVTVESVPVVRTHRLTMSTLPSCRHGTHVYVIPVTCFTVIQLNSS
jgi:hypothetical protein